MSSRAKKWFYDPAAFIGDCLIDPESNKPFQLYEAQTTFLRHAFERTPEGKMRYTELVFSAPKKSGKSALGAMIVIYTAAVLAPANGEIYLLANDLEQSSSRIFKAVAQIIEASPMLRDAVDITATRITFRSSGTIVAAVANDFAGFSGSNPTLNCYDELAYYTSENSRRLWDEGIASPARRISFRLSVSTAGFDNEPSPLRDLYERAMKAEQIAPDLYRDGKLLCYWATTCKAPWQSEDWINEQRVTYAARPHQFARLIENAWTSSEDVFIPLDMWDKCVDGNAKPVLSDPLLDVWVGLDASVSRDRTAIVVCTFDKASKCVRLVRHRVFTPSKENPIDFENDIEREIKDLRSRFFVRQVLFDPWQLISVSQRLLKLGIPMEPVNQTSGNLTETGNTLLELVKYRRLVLYPDAEMRVAVSRCVAKESSRGWRIGKTTASHSIDVIVALSLACLGAVRNLGKIVAVHRWAEVAAGVAHYAEPLPKLEDSPEYRRMLAAQAQLCLRCGRPLGASSIPLTSDGGAVHAYDCNKPAELQRDSFGDVVKPGSPGLVDILKAGTPLPRERAE